MPFKGEKRTGKGKQLFKKKVGKSKLTQKTIADIQGQYLQIDPKKIKTFDDFPLSDLTKKALKEFGYEEPTEIQRETLALGLRGLDILGAAKTGSGKTLAFLIPLIEKLFCLKWTATDGLGALVITPTRELAYQIFETLRKIGKYHDFSAGLVIGGKDLKFESSRLSTCNIVICTPGRILQHMDENPNFDPTSMKLLVLDEADRCLDMGFSSTMNAILENLPTEDRQTLLFSATQTRSVKDLARLSLEKPVFVSVHEHSDNATPEKLTQSYIVCELSDKINTLWSFIKNHRKKKILVFLQSCKQVKYVNDLFKRLKCGTSTLALHGKLHQLRRMAIYDEFCQRQTSVVLLATDVASRGLDFPGVDWVLQLDCPEDAKTYLHRVGRTARHSSVGQSLLTLLPSEETGMIKQLKIHKIPIDKIQVDPRKLVNMQRKIEAHLASDVELKSSAQRAFQSYLKSTYLLKNKDVFDVLKLDTDKFAISLGLAIPPRVRFLQKQLKLKQGRGHAQADEQKKVSLDLDSDESDSDQDDMLQIKRKDHNIEDDDNKASEDDLEAAELDLEKKVKIVTKAQAAKKTLKKNQTPNQKILFNEEGQGQEQGLTLKASVEGQAYDHEEVGQGGIDLEKVKKVLKAEDKFDKQVDKEKRKTKKREERMKSKAKSKRNGEGKGDDDDFAEESDDDSEGPNLDWLPDPDKIYGSKHQEDQSDQEESSSEDENPGSKRKWKPPKKPEKRQTTKRKKPEENPANLEDLALQLLKN